jgi:hypothetical protein
MPSDKKNEGHAIRYARNMFEKNRDKSLLVVISVGYRSSSYYDLPEYYEDTCQAISKLIKDGVIIHYFNIGGLPDRVMRSYQNQLDKNIKNFKKPTDLSSYAPIFVGNLIEKLAN